MKTYTIKLSNKKDAILLEYRHTKTLISEDYNYIFNKSDGFFIRWGKTKDDDGDLNLGLPEIADIEISTSCHGVNRPCTFCYKSNNPYGKFMSFETFEAIFKKLPKTVTQIAFGIGDIDSNPDLWKIMEYCRKNGVIPNITINGARMTSELFDNLAKYCGAVAVSVYDKDLTYNAIKELTDRGMSQINIHFMISEETYDKAFEVMTDIQNDERLEKMNAIVFLSLKTKGNAKNNFTQLCQEKFDNLVEYALDNKIRFGFDSCSSRKYFNYLDQNKEMSEDFKQKMTQCVEPCESSVYSSYISVDGNYYPCSFCESIEGWEEGINVLESKDFLEDVWQNEKTKEFRGKLLGCNRDCPIYKI
jgi:MoaA/NifB/PqqE/SkfB family radical SAM enzyme